MFTINRLASGLGFGALTLLGVSAHAQEARQAAATGTGYEFRLEGKVGAEYSSNVAVLDLDANTGEDDWAATINALAEVGGSPMEGLTLRGGYEFTQTLHDEFKAFDLILHRGYAEVGYDFKLVTLGVLGNVARASLDGDEYLTFTQVSPYISRQVGDALFLRASYAATDKTFEGRPGRDARSDTIAADAYVFLDGIRRYIIVGGKAFDEDAASGELDFGGGSVRLRLVQRLDVLDREMTLRAGVEYEQRDYDDPTPPIGAPREDRRTGVDASLEAPLTDNIFFEGAYRFGDYESNLATADYEEHVASLKLGVRY